MLEMQKHCEVASGRLQIVRGRPLQENMLPKGLKGAEQLERLSRLPIET